MADLTQHDPLNVTLHGVTTGKAPVSGLVRSLVRAVLTWESRRHARRGLARLDAHMLRDIGLTADHIRDECDKPFWRA